MSKLRYANSPDYASADTVIFGANTRNAGTAPTFTSVADREGFSADFIRRIDNKLHSLPENFKCGRQLWDEGNLIITKPTLADEVQTVYSKFCTLLNDGKKPICLGGDHIIKFAALKALDAMIPREYGVIYLDAHPDCEVQEKLSYSSILHHGFLQSSFTPNK